MGTAGFEVHDSLHEEGPSSDPSTHTKPGSGGGAGQAQGLTASLPS